MTEEIFNNTFNILSYICVLLAFDKIGKRVIEEYNDTTRWIYLHIITNIFTSTLTFPEMYNTLYQSDVELYFNRYVSPLASNITLGLHLYHLLFFGKLRSDDYIHHISMIGTMLVVNIYRGGSITNYLIFYLNGFPGLIDYTCLFITRMGGMESMTQKLVSLYINTWIRVPGILYGCSMLWLYWRLGYLDYIPNIPIFFNLVTCFWNGPYYGMIVSYNYGYRVSETRK